MATAVALHPIGTVAPIPPVRSSTTVATAGKQKPPPVPPRGEQTRLTTVPAKKPAPESVPVMTVIPSPSPSPPPPPPPKTRTPSPPPPPPPSQPVSSTVVEEVIPPLTTEPDDEEDLSASALISKFESSCAVKLVAEPRHLPPAPVEVDSGTSTLAESTDDENGGGGSGSGGVVDDDEEDDGAADIWVRSIESPVKNPQKVRHHSDSAIKAATGQAPSPLAEKRGSLPATAVDTCTNDKKGSPPMLSKSDTTTRLSFRSAAGSRCSSPALLTNNKPDGSRKISAAEALGVVAKPCPRILPSSASLDAACRRQSLGNLTESRFGTMLPSSIRSSWAPPSGVQTDVESTQSEPSFDYRRKKFTKRCSSADGRNPVHHHHHHHHYHTLQSGARASAARDPDFGAKRAFIQEKLQQAVVGGKLPVGLPPTPPPPVLLPHHHQQMNGGDCGKPPRSSTCNCGQHQATSRPMFFSKRTVSAEELLPPPAAVTMAQPDEFTATGRSVSGSSSSSSGGRNGSFGRSQRVTFALDQQQMFVSGRPASAEPASSAAVKKPFKSNLKVKDVTATTVTAAVPDLNMLSTGAINTRLPPQHPHPYGQPFKLPAATTADVLQVVRTIIITIYYCYFRCE